MIASKGQGEEKMSDENAKFIETDDDFMHKSMSDAEFENYVRACNSDIPIEEVTFFLPEFAGE